ncbi:MAG: ParB/RepB/Spo0J family partition protein [Pseudosphingobacterium sp.]|nr:ParB/RepB/Spo0J family partition protein [Pseudosphingobacterium sp.]
MKSEKLMWITFGAYKGEKGIVVDEKEGVITVEVQKRDGTRPKASVLKSCLEEMQPEKLEPGTPVLIATGTWKSGDFKGMLGTVTGLTEGTNSIYDVEVYDMGEKKTVPCYQSWLKVTQLPEETETDVHQCPFDIGDLVLLTKGIYKDKTAAVSDISAYRLTTGFIYIDIFSDDLETIIKSNRMTSVDKLKKINDSIDFPGITGTDFSGEETSIGDTVKIMDGKFKGSFGKAVEFLGKVMTKVEIDDPKDGLITTACFNSWLIKSNVSVEISSTLERDFRPIGEALTELLKPSEKVKQKRPKSNVKAIEQESPLSYRPTSEPGTVELKNIPLRQLVASPTNPRKTFHENDLQELSDSIREKGVVQPIVVRKSDQFADTYEVVCGERRFRASKIAGVDSIPAVVRSLTDSEALDLQIVENLQRKNVHPMEEASAFKVLNENNGISIQDMAIKVGKSESYVAKRLKLNDLIPDIQEMFLDNKVSLSLALKLSRTDGAIQNDVIKPYENWREKSNWKLDNYNVSNILERHEVDLDDAPFDLADKTLKQETGPCLSCQYNSSNQPLLFGDEKSICRNPACYASKIMLNLEIQIGKSVNENIVFLNETYHPSEQDKTRIKELRDIGMPVLNIYDDYRSANADEEGPDIMKGLIISSYHQHSLGSYKNVRLLGKLLSKPDGSSPNIEAKNNILSKEARAKELDICKNINAVIEGIKSVEVEKLSENKMQLSTAERIAITYALYDENRYGFGSWLRSQIGIKQDYPNGNDVFNAIKEKFESLSCALLDNHQQLFLDLVIRKYIMSYIVGTTEFSHNPFRTGPGHTIDMMATEWYGNEYQSIKIKQQEIADKRANRVEQKLKQLENEKEG